MINNKEMFLLKLGAVFTSVIVWRRKERWGPFRRFGDYFPYGLAGFSAAVTAGQRQCAPASPCVSRSLVSV